jgi:murein DD-endopeptidase MepM/ murein hydrolase activator NlpD
VLSVLGLRAGLSLARPVLWAVGGLVVLLLAGGAASLDRPASASASPLPVAGARITQGFGCTTVAFEPADAACASGHFHSGVDLAAAEGTPVYSVCAGRATPVLSTTGYGIHMVVECGGGLLMLYGHLAAPALRATAPVGSGALLGWVGSTGLSTGPHVHFEVRRGGTAVDPMPWLPAYPGDSTSNLRREQRW